MPGLGYRLGSK